MTELKNRGVNDVFIACVDGLKGFPEAIETAFPRALVQLCIVHLVRLCLNFTSWKQRKQVASSLRPIYTAPTREAAQQALDEFAAVWDKTHPTISQVWRRNWEHITPFFEFPAEIRKVIYTTNAVESLNSSFCAKSSRRAARFPMKRRRSSCCIWRCAITRKNGARCRAGAKRSTAFKSSGRSACRRSKGIDERSFELLCNGAPPQAPGFIALGRSRLLTSAGTGGSRRPVCRSRPCTALGMRPRIALSSGRH